ncbi:MAG: SpoIIE family protein phosphatase [Vicinamibacterales bacterium]
MLLDWAVAERALPGQAISGDLHVVEPFPDGVLVAVIDALGHGDEAAAAARLAASTVRAHAHEAIPTLIRICHERLRAARGVVMSAASFNARNDSVTWGGVGNVEGFLVRSHASGSSPREALVLRNGVVGFHLPEVRSTVRPIARGDVLVLATDGIATGFLDDFDRGTPQDVADRILARYGKPTDDALVLVAAYIGMTS